MADGYYTVNFNHPATGVNDLYSFNNKANQPELNFAKIGLEYSPAPVGFRLDAGFGQAFNVYHSFDPNRDMIGFHHILQAYVSFKPKSWHGIEIDGGKFYTSAGAEVTETHLNWNYSRALLFELGPFYHVGVRSTIPIGKHFVAGVQLVNGWNNLVDNNTGKTVGVTSTLTLGKVTWGNNYYTGPEKTDTNSGYRNFYDSVLTVAANKKTSLYVNFDAGRDKRIGPGASVFYGIAGAVHYQATDRLAFTPRLEFYNDRDGFATGTPQKLKEYTLTAEYKIYNGVLSRFEYRHDFSNTPFFHRGNDELVKHQPTLTVGLIAFFGPKQ